jgi:hypothetical protein
MSKSCRSFVVVAGCVILGNACDDAGVTPVAQQFDAGGEGRPSSDAGESSWLHTAVDTDTRPDVTSASRTMADSSSSVVTLPLEGGAFEGIDAGVGASTNTSGSVTDVDSGTPDLQLPPSNGGLDYQLGGAYELPAGVTIVSRDRTEAPAPGAYNICYVNGFQAQPGEEDGWEADLLLHDDNGELIIDEDWNEAILDISTASKRERIALIVGAWIRQCGSDGFQAVEIDNLDTYTRFAEHIEEDDAVDFITRLSSVAHAAGMAIAQKNAVELVPRREEMGTDFVVAEQCNTWEECSGYIDSYGALVLMVEYEEGDFERGCELYGDEFSIVLRDRDLTGPSSDTYVFSGC